DQTLGNRLGCRRPLFRQVLALVGVEHRESLEEWDHPGLIAVAFSPLALFFGRETVCVDDSRAVFAFADIAAEATRLAKGEPALAGEEALNDGPPKDQHVDAGIAALGRRVFRHGERRFRRRGPPRLDPGHAASLQLCDDL